MSTFDKIDAPTISAPPAIRFIVNESNPSITENIPPKTPSNDNIIPTLGAGTCFCALVCKKKHIQVLKSPKNITGGIPS